MTQIGSLIIDVNDKELTPEERELVAHPLVGGVILFTRNFDSQSQLKNLCRNIRSARKQPLLILVDQEGGRVQRFIKDFTRLPPMAVFGKLYAKDPTLACQTAKDCGWLMATELLSAGIDLSLAPVLDLNKGISGVIGDRAFDGDPMVVIVLAKQFIQGMHEAGMASTAKHFPGHGSVSADSHVAIPQDERSLQAIEKEDLLPFAELIKANVSAVMAAHIIFPNVDKHPVGFSSVWLNDILRKKLAFNGPILSDDLNMEGANISANYAERVSAAKEAGCDFALLCNNRPGVIQVLDNLAYQNQLLAIEKWGMLQGRFNHVVSPLKENKRWQNTRDFLQATCEMQNII